MADDSDTQLPGPQSSECSDINGDHTEALQYPHILLETPFDSLLTHSYIANNSSPHATMADPPPRHPPASLSESWASISDAELSQEDDLRSEQTDLGSLVDIRNADDILSLQEEDVDAATSDDEQDEEVPQTHEPLETTYASQMKPSEQTPTAGTSLTESSLLPTHLTLSEAEDAQETDDVSVRHVLKVFEETQTESLGFDHDVRLQNAVGTINLKLGKSSLKDTGRQSLHLLILGKDYLPSLRNSIMGKVADALVASGSAFGASPPRSPSRYHIVPDCFGPGSMPSAAEVIPIDCQLEVDSFTSAKFLDQTHQTISLYSETSSKVLESGRHDDGYAIRGTEGAKPDLAVVVVSSSDTSAQIDETCVMLIFAQRHSIPVLVITVDDDWSTEFCPLVLSSLSASRRVESKLEGHGDAYRLLPLDLDTFLSLNPTQLSRHFAYLIEAPVIEDENARGSEASSLMSIGAGEKSWKQQLYGNEAVPGVQQMKRVWAETKSWFVVLLCAILLAQAIVSLGGYRPSIKSLPDSPAATRGESSIYCTAEVEVSSTPALAARTVEVVPALPLTIDATKSIAGSFEVEVIGNSHLVVRTPLRPKRKGALNVTVLRDAEPVPVQAKELFPNVYSVHVAKEEMYGNLTVRLEITNPYLVDTVTLNLGKQPFSLWLRDTLDEAKREVNKKLAHIQLSPDEYRQTAFIQRSQHLPKLLEKMELVQKRLRIFHAKIAVVEGRIQAWNKRIDDSGAEMLEHVKASTNKMLGDGMSRMEQMRQKSRSFWQEGLPKLQNKIAALQDAVGKLQVGQRAQNATQSETLATAQGRAQHIVRVWRQRMSQDHQG